MDLNTPRRPNDDEETASELKFIRRILIIAAFVALAGLIYVLSDVLLLVFGAILFAVILRVLADPLSTRLGLSDPAALLVASLGLFLVVAGGIFLFGTQLTTQLAQLYEQLPKAVEAVSTQLGINLNADIFSGTAIGNLISTAYTWATTVVSVLAGILIIVFGGIYLATSPTMYRNGLVMLFPTNIQQEVEKTLDDIGRCLKLWLTAQFLAMIIVGAATAVGLWLVGLPSALALGLIAGLAEFIPVVGPIASAIPGLLIAASLGWETMLWALAVYIIVQQLESNLIMPLLVGSAVNIAPAIGLFAVIALSVIFGPLGLLFAYPLAVVADVAVRRLYIRNTLGEQVEISGEKER